MATASSSFYKGSDDLDLTCDVCQHQNKISIAVSYCETCEEALCQTCDNVHRNLKLTGSHSLLTGDQLIDIKLVKQFREFGNVQDTSHVNACVPGRKKGTSRPSGRGAVRMTGTSGDNVRVNYSDRDTDTVPSVLDLTVSDIKHHDVGCKEVQSVVFMPSGHVVLAWGKDGLKLLDRNFKQVSRLSLYSGTACKVSDTEVLVTRRSEKQIQFVQVLPIMVANKVLTIGKVTFGVCYHNGEIYVACSDNKRGKGEVRVMSMDGTVVRRLGFQFWSLQRYMFDCPYDVKVNNAGDKVFVTDECTHSVTCMDQVGREIYKYTDTHLRCPTGMLVDRQDNVLVTAFGSENVYAINKVGRKRKIVLNRGDGLYGPLCISYRHDGGLLAIGMCSNYGKGALMTAKASLA